MFNQDDDVGDAAIGNRLMVDVMRLSHYSWFAYLLAGVALLLVIGGGGGLALYLHSHRGAPPPVLVVVDQPALTTTLRTPVSSTPTQTPPPVEVAPVPPPLPDGVGYTAAPLSKRPDLYNTDGYGWLTRDAARCPSGAVMVGRTPESLFVVCHDGAGYFFRSTALKNDSSIEIGQLARSGAGFTGAQGGRTVEVSASSLTVGTENGVVDIQDVVQSWFGNE